MKRADRSGAHLALLLGAEELARGMNAVKDLRDGAPQHDVPHDAIVSELRAIIAARGTGS